MKETFSLLEKDDKTYNYVKQYYKVIKEGHSPMIVDAYIQKNEIERHLCLKCVDPDDQKSICEWIQCYSSSFRSYLNSLKMLALSIFFMNKYQSLIPAETLSFELFCRAVNIWNERKEEVVDSIFI